MKQALLVGSIVGLTCGGTHYALSTLSTNHDSAFCALLEEIWKDEKQKSHKKIMDYQNYLESGTINTIFNKPPHNAYDRFHNVDLFEFDKKIRLEAMKKIDSLFFEIQNDIQNKRHN